MNGSFAGLRIVASVLLAGTLAAGEAAGPERRDQLNRPPASGLTPNVHRARESARAGGASRLRMSPREVMLSDDPQAGWQVQRTRIERERRTRQHPTGASPASAQQQSTGAAIAGSTTGNVRLSFRDIGPDTGFSGSGTGFTFNRDTNQVILPSPRRVFRSENGGRNWSPLDLAVTASGFFPGSRPPQTEGSYYVRQNPRDPRLLFAVTARSGNLARSNDFGATWTQLGVEHFEDLELHDFADVAFHEALPSVVLALTKEGRQFGSPEPVLWRSEDSGATFTPQWASGLPMDSFDPDTGEGCVPFYSNIATTPAEPNIVYVVQQNGDNVVCPAAIHKSIDGGLTFVRLEASSSPPNPNPIQVFPHPTRPKVLFAQSGNPFNSSIHRSTDGGASFQLLTGGLANQNFFVSFDRNNPLLVYAAGRGGVFRSQDGGDKFKPLGLTAEQLGRFAANVDVDPGNSNVIYANTWNGNFKSFNGGHTFTAINRGWKAAVIRAIGFDNSSDPTLYLATDHGILRTHTRGQTFEPVPHPRILNNTVRLAIAPSDPNMILATTRVLRVDTLTTEERRYRTLDGGQSWIEPTVVDIPDPDNFFTSAISVDPQNSNNVYFLGQTGDSAPGFYRSVDAGATFERTVPAFFSVLAIHPIDPRVIFAGVSGPGSQWPLHKSVDGGLSFAPTNLQGGFSQTGVGQILVDPQKPENIFLNGGGVLFCFR